jgi:hypothetical protein
MAIKLPRATFRRFAAVTAWIREPALLLALVRDAYAVDLARTENRPDPCSRLQKIRVELSPITRAVVQGRFALIAATASGFFTDAGVPPAWMRPALLLLLPAYPSAKWRGPFIRRLWQCSPRLFYLTLHHELGLMAEETARRHIDPTPLTDRYFLDTIHRGLDGDEAALAAVLTCATEDLIFTPPDFKFNLYSAMRYSSTILKGWLHALDDPERALPPVHPLRTILQQCLRDLAGLGLPSQILPFHRCHGRNENAIKAGFTRLFMEELAVAAATHRRSRSFLSRVLADISRLEPDLYEELALNIPLALWMNHPAAARTVFVKQSTQGTEAGAAAELSPLGRRFFASVNVATFHRDPKERTRLAATRIRTDAFKQQLLRPEPAPKDTP